MMFGFQLNYVPRWRYIKKQTKYVRIFFVGSWSWILDMPLCSFNCMLTLTLTSYYKILQITGRPALIKIKLVEFCLFDFIFWDFYDYEKVDRTTGVILDILRCSIFLIAFSVKKKEKKEENANNNNKTTLKCSYP